MLSGIKKLTKELVISLNKLEQTVYNYNDADFRSHFRLTRSSVELIWNKLSENALSVPSSSGKPPVPILKSILISLWLVGTQESYRSIGDRFDVTKSTVYTTFNFIRLEIIRVSTQAKARIVLVVILHILNSYLPIKSKCLI